MKQQSETVPFRKIKKGEFFRSTHAPKRLYQKYNGALAQTVDGPGVGKTRCFLNEQDISVAAKIIGV